MIGFGKGLDILIAVQLECEQKGAIPKLSTRNCPHHGQARPQGGRRSLLWYQRKTEDKQS
jgi:hypothetical protein